MDPRATIQSLALYYADWCPYCVRVLNVMEQLGIQDQLIMRDIDEDSAHSEALWEARGRGTVPVLRISRPGGDDQWMPESADIIGFLRQRFG